MNTVKTILLLSIMGSFFGYTHGSDQITSVMNFLSGAANFWPSEEEKARQAAVKQQYEFLNAKQEYKECLMGNTKSERRKSSGIPCNCKTFANKFAMAGGEAEVENMTRTFNKYRTR